jgi:putative transposase
MSERKAMIDRNHRLALTKQAALLGISRGSVYYEPAPVSDADLALMRRLDELHLEFPFAGSRMLRGLLAAEGSKVGRRHVTTLMRRMGIEAISMAGGGARSSQRCQWSGAASTLTAAYTLIAAVLGGCW